MSCYRPGRLSVVSAGVVRYGRLPRGFAAREIEVPCGKCIGCCMDRALMWKIRIMHEKQLYDRSLFVTLTYSDEKLPTGMSLDYSHFQGFMRRLRRRCSGMTGLPELGGFAPLRFFMCGEYGEETSRPHFHAVLFNCAFRDERRLHNGKLRSEECESIWSYGNVDIALLNGARAGYVAGYVVKKAERRSADLVSRSTGEVFERRPEFQEMSSNPGLGAYWYQRFGSDLFPHDGAVLDGKVFKVPRFYLDRYGRRSDQAVGPTGDVQAVKDARIERARAVEASESSVSRRKVKEEFALAKFRAMNRRSL